LKALCDDAPTHFIRFATFENPACARGSAGANPGDRSLWIVPKLRTAKVWFALFLLVFLCSAGWIGVDLYQFTQARGSSKEMGLRTLYLLLSNTNLPALQCTLGFLMGALLSWQLGKPVDATLDRPEANSDSHS